MGLLQDRDFFDILSDLNSRLNNWGGKSPGTNIIERYTHFLTTSDRGKNCSYARKYRELFITHDWKAVTDLITEAATILESIESDRMHHKTTMTTGTVRLPFTEGETSTPFYTEEEIDDEDDDQ